MVLCLAVFLSGCGKSKFYPKPTPETCSDKYKDTHPYLLVANYNNETINKIPQGLKDYWNGCDELMRQRALKELDRFPKFEKTDLDSYFPNKKR